MDDRIIYVASLSDYNGGILHGVHINLDNCDDEDALWDTIKKMLADSPYCKKYPYEKAEEWAIHDYEGFGAFKVSEWSDPAKLLEFAEATADLPATLYLAFTVWYENEYSGDNIGDALWQFQDGYLGTYDSTADYAYEYEESVGTDIPDSIRQFIDWEAYGESLLEDCWTHWIEGPNYSRQLVVVGN